MSRRTDEPSAPHALTASDTPHAKLRRLRALVWKETRQIVRDPSSIAMGVILPLILILLFGFGLSGREGRAAGSGQRSSPPVMPRAYSRRCSCRRIFIRGCCTPGRPPSSS